MYSHNIEGRFALVESLNSENTSILVFETPYFVTGENMAVIGCFDGVDVKNMNVGDTIEIQFDASSALTFEEEISARRKGQVTLTIGCYSGSGLLVNESTCDFKFSSDILIGEWRIGLEKSNFKKGILGKIFNNQNLKLEKII